MKLNNLSYTTRIWLFSVIVSPLLVGLTALPYERIELDMIGNALLFYGVMLLFGALCSLPAYSVFILTNEGVFQNIRNVFVSKIVASLIGLLICYLIVIVIEFIMDGDIDLWNMGEEDGLYLFLSYPFTIFFAIWYFEPNHQ